LTDNKIRQIGFQLRGNIMKNKVLTFEEWCGQAAPFQCMPYEVHGLEVTSGMQYPLPDKVNCAARQGESPPGERRSSGGEGALGYRESPVGEPVRIGNIDKHALDEPCFAARTPDQKEVYITDRLERAECWLWEQLTGRTCPLRECELAPAPPGYRAGVYPFARAAECDGTRKIGEKWVVLLTCLTDLVPEQVETIFNDQIGAMDGFGDAMWLNFAAIDRIWPNKYFRQFQDNGAALYKHDAMWQLLMLKSD